MLWAAGINQVSPFYYGVKEKKQEAFKPSTTDVLAQCSIRA